MKNMFKLVSVFMVTALLVTTLLVTGAFASGADEKNGQPISLGALDKSLVGTATAAEPTETKPTYPNVDPADLTETLLLDNAVGGVKTVKPEKTDAWFLLVDEIKEDIAKNGPIDPMKGEYYEVTVTGHVDQGVASIHMGEAGTWEEYWGESGELTTEESTVFAIIRVAIPAEGIGSLYLADSGENGHTLTWSSASVRVFRLRASVGPTDTKAPTVAYGDANGDGAVNMKDVLAVRKHIAGLSVQLDLTAADANGDSAVNLKDVLVMRKFIAGLPVKLGA